MKKLQSYSSLIAVLKQMEADLGLSELTEAERLVVAAISSLQEKLDASEYVPSKAIMKFAEMPFILTESRNCFAK